MSFIRKKGYDELSLKGGVSLKFLKIFLLSLTFISCSHKKLPKKDFPQTPYILVSIGPYKTLTQKISKDLFEVRSIVPSKANPHAFEPTSKQVKEIAESSLWLRIGEPFETKVLTLLKSKNSTISIYDLRKNIDLLQDAHPCCSHEPLDRHIWLSPKLALKQAEGIAQVLTEKFPEHAVFFSSNFQELKQELEALDLEIQSLLKEKRERAILVSHPAFSYFCKDYGIKQLSIEFEGKEPRPKHLEETLRLVKKYQPKFALSLPQHNNKGAQLIAKKFHLPVHWIDPYSSDYFQTMKNLAQMIRASEEKR